MAFDEFFSVDSKPEGDKPSGSFDDFFTPVEVREVEVEEELSPQEEEFGILRAPTDEELYGTLREPTTLERVLNSHEMKKATAEKAVQAIETIEDSDFGRGLGYVFGTLNAPFAAMYAAANEKLRQDINLVTKAARGEVLPPEEVEQNFDEIYSKALESAKSSISEKGEWGTVPSDVLETFTGQPLEERFPILGDWADPVVDLTVGLALEGRVDILAATKALKAAAGFKPIGRVEQSREFRNLFSKVDAKQVSKAATMMREDQEFLGYLNDVVKYSEDKGAKDAITDLVYKTINQENIAVENLADELQFSVIGRSGINPVTEVADPDLLSYTANEFGRYNIQRIILDDYERQLSPEVRKRVRAGMRKNEFTVPTEKSYRLRFFEGMNKLNPQISDVTDDFAMNFNNVYAFNFGELNDKAVVKRVARENGFDVDTRQILEKPELGETIRAFFGGVAVPKTKTQIVLKKGKETKAFDSLEDAFKSLDTKGIPSIDDWRRATRIQKLTSESVETSDAFIGSVFKDPLVITKADLVAANKKLKSMIKGRSEENLVASTKKTLAKYGLRSDAALNTPLGKTYFTKVLRARDSFVAQASEDIFNVTNSLVDLSEEQTKNVRLVLEGISATSDPAVLKASTEIRKILDDLHERGTKAGIDIKYRENYFPHIMLKHEVLTGTSRSARKKIDRMLQDTVDEGLFENTEEASRALRGYINQIDHQNLTDFSYLDWMIRRGQASDYITAQSLLDELKYRKTEKFNPNLQAKREANIPWYDRDIASSLSSYLYSANKMIENRKAFPLDFDNAPEFDRYLKRIKQEGGNIEVAKQFTKLYFHPEEITGNRLANFLMSWQVVTKLGPLTTALNYTQHIATAVRTNPQVTMKAFWNTLRGKDQRFAERCGAILSQTIKESMAAQGVQGGIPSFYMRSIGFTTAERILRSTAANAGRYYAMDLFNMLRDGKHMKYSRRRLEEMGVDVNQALARGQLSDDDLLRVGKNVSDATQFRGDEFQVPVGWIGSPWARVITQFKTFAYNQAVFAKRQILDEAKRGNMRPLIYAMSLYPPAGVGYKLLETVVLGKEPPESLPDWIFESIAAVGSLGLWQSAYEAVARGEVGALEFLGGPTISGAVEGAVTSYKAMHGNLAPMIKQWGRQVPYAGRFIYYWSLRDLESTNSQSRGARSTR